MAARWCPDLRSAPPDLRSAPPDLRSVANYGIGFDLPDVQLVVFLWIAILAGTVAAVLPARRAARLNVLQALQYE